MRSRTHFLTTAALAVGALLALSACSSGGGPFDSTSTSASSRESVTVGSAAFGESEILMQIYGQALAAHGVSVAYKPSIGQREAYLAALKDGSINLVPEYTGNLLQFYAPSSTVSSSTEVFAALQKVLPKGMTVLNQSAAQDADSYNVTKAFSQKWGVTSLDQLGRVTIPLMVAANPEFATRPYGIPGLKSVYGVTATLKPISDSGGPLTVSALVNGDVQLADIFTTSPAIKDNNLVTLSDPKHLIVAQNVVPLISSASDTATVRRVLNAVSARLTTADLIQMNGEYSGAQKLQPNVIAKRWLEAHPLSL